MKLVSSFFGVRGSNRIWWLAAALFVALAASLACGGALSATPTAGVTPQPTPDPVADPVAGGIVANVGGIEVEVELGEWFTTAGKASAPAGYVTLEGKNTGKEAHEIVVMRTDLPADKLVVD
ncbi:MAG: hypothetical protein HY681_14705, partial [Chloroflexi bacterium]|nr:hypothetical protein [Chloroflexota bacterium]